MNESFQIEIEQLNRLPRVQRMRTELAKGFNWADPQTGWDMARMLERSLQDMNSAYVLRHNNGLNLPLIKTFFREADLPPVKGWSQKGVRAVLAQWQTTHSYEHTAPNHPAL